jgi:hypothetical protein
MTYDWNKQVEITVPTGTNGWIYSGEVIINGVKVRFPVGVPTTVPEPAAALLNKMIELEREEENNTAKPDNHYVGSVTIPEGKTLTLAKGAKVVDEDGLLGGSSTPDPVVILPETELSGGNGAFVLKTPLNADLETGKTYNVMFNSASYDLTAFDNDGVAVVGAQTEGDGIPFQFNQAPPEVTAAEGIYGVCYVLDATLTSVTLSIVEAAKTESAGGGSVLIVDGTVTNAVSDLDFELEFTIPQKDIIAELNAGKMVILRIDFDETFILFSNVSYTGSSAMYNDFADGMFTQIDLTLAATSATMRIKPISEYLS